MFSGDGTRDVLNVNAGITDADYYEREKYRKAFNSIFERLREQENLFTRTLPEIINSDLFKLSPFKALNHDQAFAIEEILEGLFADLEIGASSASIVQGSPGTGKTVVAVYLIKLLHDIRDHRADEPLELDSIFSEFFTAGYAELLTNAKIAFVVPQQSLRNSVTRVFARTPGLSKTQVLSPFDVGESVDDFDLLIVDEAHRLNHRANQPSAHQNTRFANINKLLFEADNDSYTQLDWIREKSKHQILMLDTNQAVRPADLPDETTQALLLRARSDGRLHNLQSQMRVKAGQDYIGYVRSVLTDNPPPVPQLFDGYDLRFFTDLGAMHDAIKQRDQEFGLSRLVAGYAWPWRSKSRKTAFDIDIDGRSLRWNSTALDWISSSASVEEVGSIHTVQGYDLNYAGVIIGPDLKHRPDLGQLVFSRKDYYDTKGKENNKRLQITYSDDDLLQYVRNIYTVLLTRGILGTYIYVCDPALREYLSKYFPANE